MTSDVLDARSGVVASSLWEDWCAASGHDPRDRAPGVIEEFRGHVRAPQRLLRLLMEGEERAEQIPDPERAPAWKPGLVLSDLLGSLARGEGALRWPDRLRARRDAFILVLAAPTAQGGLGLPRASLRALVAKGENGLLAMRGRVGTAESREGEAARCPACAAHRWLRAVGVYEQWSPASVRSLASTSLDLGRHACGDPDPEPGWVDARTLLPAIDQHGWLATWESISARSVTSVLGTRAGVGPASAEVEEGAPEPDEDLGRPLRHFEPEEAEAAFDAADEVNRRIKALLDNTEALVVGSSAAARRSGGA